MISLDNKVFANQVNFNNICSEQNVSENCDETIYKLPPVNIPPSIYSNKPIKLLVIPYNKKQYRNKRSLNCRSISCRNTMTWDESIYD